MKLTDIPPRKRFWRFYVPILLAAIGGTLANIWGLISARDFVTSQFLLSYITALGLLSTVEGSAPLTRRLALLILCASAVANILCHAAFHQNTGVNDTTSEDSLVFYDYLYFSMVTFTTLGFGDLQPAPAARLAAAFQALSGYVYLGLFIGVMTGGFKPAQNGGGRSEFEPDKS